MSHQYHYTNILIKLEINKLLFIHHRLYKIIYNYSILILLDITLYYLILPNLYTQLLIFTIKVHIAKFAKVVFISDWW